MLTLAKNVAPLFILTILGIAPVNGHGGGLDLQGCHTDKKTRIRHCHRSGVSTITSDSDMVAGLATLVSIGDGDTVRVISGKGVKVTIRLACIDAPETSHGASGEWSTKTLKRLIVGKSISLKPKTKDKYGRTVAEIFTENMNINLQMVEVGAAYAYRQYLKQCDQSTYLNAETYARNKGLGVWGPYKPAQLPWEHRRSRRR
ncbi:MAG: Thermonuclease [Prochlorococcus marinus str. MIT 9215]|nr:MAG: Thermonuclease [Prochlorococcus marinus str. MIT 9215]